MRFETISVSRDGTTFARFARMVDEDGRFVIRAGLSHLTLTNKATGKPILLINMIGPDVNDTAFRHQAAEGKKWNVQTEHIAMFDTLFSKDDPLLLKLLRSTDDND